MSTLEWGVSVREGEREKNYSEKEEETHHTGHVKSIRIKDTP